MQRARQLALTRVCVLGPGCQQHLLGRGSNGPPRAGVAAPSVLCLAVVNTLSTSKPVPSRCFGSLRCTAWHRGLRAPDVCTSLSEALVPSSSLFIFAQLNIKASKHLVCLCSAVCPITFFQGSHIVPVASLGAGSVEPGCQW